MNEKALDAAILIGQLLSVLSPAARDNKPLNRAISNQLSTTHELIIRAAVAPDPDQKALCERALEKAAKTLATRLRHWMDVTTLVTARAKGERISLWKASKRAAPGIGANLSLPDARQLLGHLFDERDAATPLRRGPFGDGERAKMLHAYASLVRNSSWAPVLSNLGIADPQVVTQVLQALHRTMHTHPGQAALLLNYQTLCPRLSEAKKRYLAVPQGDDESTTDTATKPAVCAEDEPDLLELKVSIDVARLTLQPAVTALLRSLSDEPWAPGPSPAAQLLASCAGPFDIPAGSTPQQVAQRHIDECLEGLRKLSAEAAARRRAAQKEARERAKQEAAASLQKLDPKVLKALQDNPDLIADALASLSPAPVKPAKASKAKAATRAKRTSNA